MEQDQAVDFTLNIPGKADISVKIGSLTGSGTFDSALQAFSESTMEASDIAVTEKITSPEAGTTDVAYSLASMKMDNTAEEGADGGVDSKGTYEATGLSETFTVPSMGMPLTLTAETQTGTMDISGMRMDAIYKLIAFAVANGGTPPDAAQETTLKGILKDGLPIFAHMGGTGTINAVKVTTPMGEVGLTDIGAEVEMNGLVDDGMFREAFTLNGLSLPAGIVPDWAAQLVPNAVKLDFKASSFNLAASAALMLETMNIVNPVPNTPEQDQAMLAALLPKGAVDITLAPGNITSPIYNLTFEGAFSAGPASPMPIGKATITATGLTAVEQALAAAPPEMGGQFTPMLQMAEGMGKAGADGAMVWEIESSATGVSVNGTNMMGGQ
jgi:hypothetical protein